MDVTVTVQTQMTRNPKNTVTSELQVAETVPSGNICEEQVEHKHKRTY